VAQSQDLLQVHAEDPISKDNLALLEKSKKEFKIKNKAAVEDRWVQGMSAKEKVRRYARRYLREAFPAGETATGIVVVKNGYAASTKALTEELGFITEIAVAPINLKVYNYWLIQERWVVG